MPVQIDYPSGIGQFDEWWLWGSAPDKISAVATNDGDASVITSDTGGRQRVQNYTFPPLLGVADPVISGSLTAVVREYAHGGGHLFWIIWGAPTAAEALSSTEQAAAIHNGGGSYVAVSHTAAGGQLALSSVNTQHGLDMIGMGGPSNKAEFFCTQFYRTVNFNYGAAPAAGDFTHIIGSIVGAMIGAGLSLREMPAVSALMKKRALKWLRPDEYEIAWRAWREQKHRVWSV